MDYFQVLCKSLSIVETLGAVNVICSVSTTYTVVPFWMSKIDIPSGLG